MVVSGLMMGLGNQMFQYAAGRALSLKLGVPFKVDVSSYKRYTVRKYELEQFFEITPEIATIEDLAAFNFTHPVRRYWNRLLPNKKIRALPFEEGLNARIIYELFYLFNPPNKRSVYEQRQFHFTKHFFDTPKTVYLKGYWMSYKYFIDYEAIIKKDFTIRPEKTVHLKAIADEINQCTSVAVHVRCTDKLSTLNLSLYGETSASYYASGINFIKQKKGDIKLFIFSDDIELAKKYVPPAPNCTYVSSYITNNAFEDFFLMIQCKNTIIANSSFSWWAAYLNRHDDKVVVVPERWYAISKFNYQDLYYPGWIKMPN